MAKTSFSRSNVNESTLQVSQPSRSSFDLGSVVNGGFPLGKFVPVRCEHLLPSAVLLGSITPEQTLKEIGVPEIGPLRLDTHTVAVSKRRINKDWVKVVKGSLQQQPFFASDDVFGNLLGYIFRTPKTTYTSVSKLYDLVEYVFAGSDSLTNATLVSRLYALAADNYAALYDPSISSDTSSYNFDWYHLENVRLRLAAERYSATGSASTVLPTEFSPIDAIQDIMKPYFGEGSIMDRLGYSCFMKFGRACSWMRSAITQMYNSGAFVGDKWDGVLLQQAIPASISLGSLLRLSEFLYTIPSSSLSFADTTFFRSSEWDIRASYAAWFDSLRNWHLEESSNLPNPDDWSSSSIFAVYHQGLTPEYFGQWCCFLVPRFRNYQNDLFSTIQTDDVFRHIFAPIFNDDSAVVGAPFDSTNYDEIHSLVNSITSSLNVLFPFGLFNSSLRSSQTYPDIYQADLQTMRRAGWLEKYCARNYYFPDTFEGKMQARYGISASDLLGVTSKYIEGGESFVTGQQTINATETAEMPAGSRTFQGGSAINGDTFTFAAGGDDVILVTFCSWMPLVTYSATNPHLSELSAADIVAPEFATDTRVQIQAMNLVRDLEHQESFIGYVPRYVTYRARLNEVHDEYLTDKRSFVWLRDWYSTQFVNNGVINNWGNTNTHSQFAINAYDQRVHLALDGFLSLAPWDSISYGKVTFAYSIDLPLPAAVEFI